MRMVADVARQRDVRVPAPRGGVGELAGVEAEQLRQRARRVVVGGALAFAPRRRSSPAGRPLRAASVASSRPVPRCALRRMSQKSSSSIAASLCRRRSRLRPANRTQPLRGRRERHAAHPQLRRDHRFRPGRPHRRHLRRPREPRAGRLRRRPLRRPADADDRGRELPGLPRGDHGARTDGALPRAGRALRRGDALRRRHRGRFRARAVPAVDRRRRVSPPTP